MRKTIQDLELDMIRTREKAIDAYDDYIAYGDFAKHYIIARNKALVARDAYHDALKEIEDEK